MELVGIAPQSWKNNTINILKNNETLIQRTESFYRQSRKEDPLPHFRDYVVDLSNNLADQYGRKTKLVINLLQQKLLQVNEHLKCLHRLKATLISRMEELRRDILLNKETHSKRSLRPHGEKNADGADDLLIAERQHLLVLKNLLEEKQNTVNNYIFEFDKTRSGLKRLIDERSRVTDLICNTTRPVFNTRSQSFHETGTFSENKSSSLSDPLGFFTPQCEMVLKDADSLMTRSKLLQDDVQNTLASVKNMQKQAMNAVNSGMVKKICETMNFDQKLTLAAADSRKARNKIQRYHDFTAKSIGYNQGPLSYSDLGTREKLDRPVIRVMQRHPGNQVPEAQEIIKVHNQYARSLDLTRENIDWLKLSEKRLQEDIRSKRNAMSVDLEALRNRRQKAGRRW